MNTNRAVGMDDLVVPGRNHSVMFSLRRVTRWRDVPISEREERKHRGTVERLPLVVCPGEVPTEHTELARRSVEEQWQTRRREGVACVRDDVSEAGLVDEFVDHRDVVDAVRRRVVHDAECSPCGRRAPVGYRVPVILSDRSLREQLDAGRIVIDPLDDSLIQPSSVDVRISNLFRVFRNHSAGVIDVKQDMTGLTELIEMPCGEDGIGNEPFMLHPGEFVLGSTLERIAVPNDLVGRVEGKSSLGRLGLLIHSTAGFIDAGFDGHITLELANVASLPITLYPGMKIGQISFMEMTSPADLPYGQGAKGSKYQGQAGPTPSRYFENFT